MTAFLRSLVLAGALLAVALPSAADQRLSMTFLPPDLPPGNVCNAEVEQFEEDETQVTDGEEAQPLGDHKRISFLTRDIRNLRRDDPDSAFDFIMALIERRAALSDMHAGYAETFAKIETYIAADRMGDLEESGLVASLAEQLEELSWTQTVRLSRFYRNGVGVTQDRDLARDMILDQAYLGNASALIEVLRMQIRGEDLGDWTLATEDTARLAFGGLIGKANRGLCGRAERMAREYTDGDLLKPNPALAYAWRKFAADKGGADAAWRVVEYQLNATGKEINAGVLEHYLQQAVANGAVVSPEAIDEIIDTGATTEAEVRRLLGINAVRAGSSERSSAVAYLELEARLTPDDVAPEGESLQYLREIAELPHVPGSVLTRLAEEIQYRKGRWSGRDEAEAYLREAVRLGDPKAMRLLAEIMMSDRSDPEKFGQAEPLLIAAVERYGDVDALRSLETYYRCQAPNAPRLQETEFWSEAYYTANVAPISVASNDLARLDPRREPETLARIQSLALGGHGSSTADWLQVLQADSMASEAALRHWGDRVGRSDVALERFTLHEFETALTPGQRDNAVELFRRAYLSIGPAISLELAVALVEDGGRDPQVADEIVSLLEKSARRGEGAAMRLLQQLTGRTRRETYEEYAEVLATRGDFVANAYLAPEAPADQFDLYMGRAISIMSCSAKAITELTLAYGDQGNEAELLRWARISQSLEHKNSLTRLRLSEGQFESFQAGNSIAEDMIAPSRNDAEVAKAARRAFLLASNPRGPDFDAAKAADHLAQILKLDIRSEYIWALGQYRKAVPEVRKAVDQRIDIRSGLSTAAEAGDTVAQFEYGMFLRSTAQTRRELKTSADWLAKAASGGHGNAMIEYARAIGFGLGRDSDPKLALIWLDRAEGLYPGRGSGLRSTFTAMLVE